MQTHSTIADGLVLGAFWKHPSLPVWTLVLWRVVLPDPCGPVPVFPQTSCAHTLSHPVPALSCARPGSRCIPGS